MTSNGRNINSGQYTTDPTAACALTSVFHSFTGNVSGVMAFSSSPYALITYLSPPLKKILLSLCLLSTLSSFRDLFKELTCELIVEWFRTEQTVAKGQVYPSRDGMLHGLLSSK
ncbi:hypothetical protein Tco_0667120, partial [Tanacetum coccineum]